MQIFVCLLIQPVSSQLEKKIHTNDANFDSLFYQSPQPMLIFDIETFYILEVNEAALAHYGYEREEFLSLSTRDLRVSEERDTFDQLKPTFKQSGNVYAEGQHLLKSGKTISVQIISYVIEYKHRQCRLAHIHDVTAVVKQARNLEILLSITNSISEELHLEVTLQKIADATTQLCGAQFGIFLYRNSLSVSSESILSACSVNAPDYLKDNASAFKKLISGKVIRLADLRENLHYRKALALTEVKDGEDKQILSFMSIPVTSKSKEVIGCLFLGHSQPDVFTDEAEKMAIAVMAQATVSLDNASLFQALLLANKEKGALLQKANEQNFKKDEFLSIASHELKTPVTSMKGYLQILEKQIGRGNQASFPDLIRKANKQVNKITHLVAELLNLSKLESGKLEYNFSMFNVGDVIADCISNLKNAEVKHTVRIFGDKNCEVYGDRNRIEQVLINLMDNAVKYSPDANEVLIGLSQDKGFLKIEIRDFGPGISEEKLSLIFERYYRGEENSYTTSGLGLGLYISSEIVKRHHGRIGVESEQGKGSTFWFVIPMQQD